VKSRPHRSGGDAQGGGRISIREPLPGDQDKKVAILRYEFPDAINQPLHSVPDIDLSVDLFVLIGVSDRIPVDSNKGSESALLGPPVSSNEVRRNPEEPRPFVPHGRIEATGTLDSRAEGLRHDVFGERRAEPAGGVREQGLAVGLEEAGGVDRRNSFVIGRYRSLILIHNSLLPGRIVAFKDSCIFVGGQKLREMAGWGDAGDDAGSATPYPAAQFGGKGGRNGSVGGTVQRRGMAA
jgi:hypothetical protein